MRHQIKHLLITSVLIFFVTTGAHALGAGVQVSGIPELLLNQKYINYDKLTTNISGTFKMERIPFTVGSGIEIGSFLSDLDYGFSLFSDFRAIDFQLVNTCSIYSGIGASVKFLTTDFRNWFIAAGARCFAGVSLLFYDGYLEFYAQQNVVPTYMKNTFIMCLPFETGMRMHF